MLAFPPEVHDGTTDSAAPDLLCDVEITSCAVDLEGHLNARVVVGVVNTFSSFMSIIEQRRFTPSRILTLGISSG